MILFFLIFAAAVYVYFALALSTIATKTNTENPWLAWIPIAILWFGIGDASPIYLIFISSVFPMIVQTTAGVHTIEQLVAQLAAPQSGGWNDARRTLHRLHRR